MRAPLLALLACACSFEPETVPDPGDVSGDPGDDLAIAPIPPEGSLGATHDPFGPEPCVKLSCADMGAACGEMDDGCGGRVACGTCAGGCHDGRCVCLADRMEPNEGADEAHSLGDFFDEFGGEETVEGLTVRDGADEDWFRLRIYDVLGLQSPWLMVELAQEGAAHDVEVFFNCDVGDDASSCSGVTEGDPRFGTACAATGEDPAAMVDVQCDGWTDSGTAWVRVRRSSFDGSCGTYSLRVRVNR